MESLIKKHEDFDRAIKVQEEKIGAVQTFADQLVDGEHYDGEDINERRDQVRYQRKTRSGTGGRWLD